MTFSEHFKAARKAVGLSQQEFADKLGLERSSISKYETGGSLPNIKNIPQICENLNISINELISWTNDK